MNVKENQRARTSTDEENKLVQEYAMHLVRPLAQDYAMQLVSSSIVPMVLKAAIDLDVLEIIHKAGPNALLSPSEIASQLPSRSNPKADSILDRILRLLASHEILTFTLVTKDGRVDKLYGLAPVAKYFIRCSSGGSLSPMLDLYQDKVSMDSWYHLKDAVLEGGSPFKMAHGTSAGEYISKDTRFGDIFKVAMIDYNKLFVEEMLKIYHGFDGLNSLVDVGGGNGFILHNIVSKYPAIKGINFDLPHIIDKSPSYPGIENVAGDAFKIVPKGDAMFMKWILHHFDDDRCVEFLKNCHEALPVSGKVIAVQTVVPESPDANTLNKSVYPFEVYSTSLNESAKERTEKEFEKVAKDAGFSRFRVACCIFGFSIMEMYKNM